MTRDDDRALEEILGPTRAFLEPEAADEARIFQGLRQALGTGVAAPRISPAVEKRQPEPRLSSSAPRSHAGLVKLASVSVIAASLGFFMGFGMGRQSALSDSGVRAVSLDPNGPERPVENLGVPIPVRPDGPTETPLASPPGTSNAGELAARDGSEALPSQLPSSPTAPTGVASRMPRRISQASLSAGITEAKGEGDGLSLGQALELLQRARSAQAAGRPNAALLLLSELDRRALGDMLTEERLLATVLVWCDLGNQHEANRLAQALRDKNQSSIYSRRLAHSCAGTLRDATSETVSSEKR